MKKYLYIALLFVGTGLMAQTAATTTVQPSSVPYPNAPEITFTEMDHDFGTLKKGASMTYRFEYKNTGKEDLIISNCRAGCECTTVKCAKTAVKPGGTGFIEAHYDSMRVGKFGKEIMVYSNARKPVVFLIIRGVVEDPNVPAKTEEKIQAPAQKRTE